MRLQRRVSSQSLLQRLTDGARRELAPCFPIRSFGAIGIAYARFSCQRTRLFDPESRTFGTEGPKNLPAVAFGEGGPEQQKTQRQAPGCFAPTHRGTAQSLVLTLACIRPSYESNRVTPRGPLVSSGNPYTTPSPRFWQAPSVSFPQKSFTAAGTAKSTLLLNLIPPQEALAFRQRFPFTVECGVFLSRLPLEALAGGCARPRSALV